MGWGVLLTLASPLMAFFKHLCYRHSPHTDISNVGGHLASGLLFVLFLVGCIMFY